MGKLTHHQRIKKLLRDGSWVCSSEFTFMRDFRKRLSELRAQGIEIESMPCDRHCGTNHESNIYMYRLKEKPKEQRVEFVIRDGIRYAKLSYA
jgi:hypothetical protein